MLAEITLLAPDVPLLGDPRDPATPSTTAGTATRAPFEAVPATLRPVEDYTNKYNGRLI